MKKVIFEDSQSQQIPERVRSFVACQLTTGTQAGAHGRLAWTLPPGVWGHARTCICATPNRARVGWGDPWEDKAEDQGAWQETQREEEPSVHQGPPGSLLQIWTNFNYFILKGKNLSLCKK